MNKHSQHPGPCWLGWLRVLPRVLSYNSSTSVFPLLIFYSYSSVSLPFLSLLSFSVLLSFLFASPFLTLLLLASQALHIFPLLLMGVFIMGDKGWSFQWPSQLPQTKPTQKSNIWNICQCIKTDDARDSTLPIRWCVIILFHSLSIHTRDHWIS